jgi:iron complex outermembrane receptor protein
MCGAMRRLFLCGVIGAGFFSHPARADTALAVGIAPQPVAAALSEFAHQTGLQLVYVSQIVKQRKSKGARAGLSAADALNQLLDGTGLSFQFLNSHTVRIFESMPAPPAQQPTGAPSRQAKPHPPWSGMLDGVLVTSSRDERQLSAAEVQDIAASMTIVSGDVLRAQASETLLDYAAIIPGFYVDDFGYPGRRAVNLRGIYSLNQTSPVAYYLDDAPLGANGSYAEACCAVLELTPYDLERLEVLRGPQGTLFGQESEVGLIRYVLKPPRLEGFEGRVGADLTTVHGGSEAGDAFRAMLNVPVVPGIFAVRISGFQNLTPGYIDNAYTGAKDVNSLRQYGGRIATLWRPTASFSLNVSAIWNRISADDSPSTSYAGFVRVPNTGDAYVLRPSGSLGGLTKSTAFAQPYWESIDYYSATANWTRGAMTVASITSWSQTTNRQAWDASGYGALYPQLSGGAIPAGLARQGDDWSLNKFTQELRLASLPGSRFDWSLGGFYTHESSTEMRSIVAYNYAYQPIAAFAPYFAFWSLPATYSDRALFGNLTWRVTRHLDLTGGLRYDRDSQAFTDTTGGIFGDPPNPPAQGSEGITNWMAAARYHFTPNTMLYARAASGYLPSVPPTAKAETLINYEVGLKSEFLDRRAFMDLGVFYIDWDGVQISTGNAPFGITTNGGQGRSEGLELTSAVSPISGMKVGFIAAYIEAGLTRVVSGPPLYLLPGYQIPGVPRWSLSTTGDYEWQLTDRWWAHVGSVFRWIGEQWGTAAVALASVESGTQASFLPSYTVLDLNASITKGPLRLRAFARNATDRRAWLGANFYVGAPTEPNESEVTIIQPRTIGVGFDYGF